ncbi:universal stress protein [Actinomycetospora soli]|uniref:universal stress protein n=1 Tax=Actinomycetospora soli TaxID=2893887 RepID=UPI001E3AA07D|nr:universal stress protein [Actinomycetospora soli]MCD2191390.1 universal stress protein [Actinomycetospora soli]
MSSNARSAVIVGADGSRGGREAVEWAAAEAEARSRRLEIVHADRALALSDQRRTPRGPALSGSSDLVLEEAVGLARVVAPSIAVNARRVDGGTVPSMSGRSAELVVIGAGLLRAHPWARGLVRPGGVVPASCPLVVVRLRSDSEDRWSRPRSGRRRAAGRVVVGSRGAMPHAALEFAFAAAAQRDVALTAVQVTPPTSCGRVVDELAPIADDQGALWEQHVTSVARMHRAFPEVRTVTACRTGDLTDVLIEESAGASLLVTTSTEGGLLRRRLSDPVDLVDRVHCPVALVRGR